MLDLSASVPPRRVRLNAARLHAATGHPAKLEQLGRRHWRVAAANERAELVEDYKPNGRGIIHRAKTRLLVNGAVHPKPRNLYDFLRVYYDLDEDEAFPRAEATPMPPARSARQAPQEIQLAYSFLKKRASKDIEIGLGYAEDCDWVIGIKGPAHEARLYHCFDGHIRLIDTRYGIQLVADGRDMSVKASSDLTKLIRLVENRLPAGTAPQAGSALSGSSDPEKTISTEVRNTVVIRN